MHTTYPHRTFGGLLVPALLALVLVAALPGGASAATTHDPSPPAIALEDEADHPSNVALRRLADRLARAGWLSPRARAALAERLEGAMGHPAAICDRLDETNAPPQWAERCAALQEGFDARSIPARTPGVVCRVVLADPASVDPQLLERCEAWAGAPQIERPRPPAAPSRQRICDAALADPESNPRLAQACREWLAGSSVRPQSRPQSEAHPEAERPDRHRICREALAAPEAHPRLAQACRTWIASLTAGSPPLPREICRRVLAAEELPGELAALAERCEPQREQLRERGRPQHQQQRGAFGSLVHPH